MQLRRFRDYQRYLEAQKATIGKRGIGPFFTREEIRRISEYVQRTGVNPEWAVCHGARNGLECDEFRKNFPHLKVFGTDLFPHSGRSVYYKGSSEVCVWDFNKRKRRWLKRFDIIYSNSLDHSNDPVLTLKVWRDQLTDRGLLALQFSEHHQTTSKGDCFGAGFWEYVHLINGVGLKLTDILYVKSHYDQSDILARRSCEVVVFIAMAVR